MPTPEELAAQTAKDAEKEVQNVDDGKDKQREEPDPVEAAARSKGWKPKDEWTGDPDEWVPAQSFIDRAPLFKRIGEQSKHIKRLTQTVEGMAKHYRANVEAAVNAKVAELTAAKQEAIREGDVDKVAAIDKAIDVQRNQAASAASTDSGVSRIPVEIETWVEKNPWYTTDAELHDFALAVNQAYLKRHPGDLEGSLRHTEKMTKKAFPEKFGVKSDDANSTDDSGRRGTPSAVESGGNRHPSKGGKYSVSRLSVEQRMVHDAYVKNGVMTTEEYIKGLESIGELQ